MSAGYCARGSLSGHLHLDCDRDGEATRLKHQSFAVPMHVSKPYWDGTALIINAVTPTAGLFSGDEVDFRLRVESGASVVMTTPSATRIHRSRPGDNPVRVVQNISVAGNAWLDFCPEMTMVQGGACFQQHTIAELVSGGEAFLMEALAPGRVASGESFAFESCRWSTEILLDGNLIALERLHLSKDDKDSLRPLQTAFPESPAGYHACAFLYSRRLRDAGAAFAAKIAAISDAQTLLAASMPSPALWVIKLLAADSLALRRATQALRQQVYQALERPMPALRKL